MPTAPGSSEAPQVTPGEQGFVPAREEMSAEAAGGGQIASQIAQTIGGAAHALGSGVQLETIRENQVTAAQLQRHFMDQATKMLYSDDPQNPGLVHQPASQFDSNVHQTRQNLVDLAGQMLDAAPNPIAKDMLRRGIDNTMDVYDKDIQGAGFAAHKAQMFSSSNDLATTMVQQGQMAPNAHSVVAMVQANTDTINQHMAPYFGTDDQGNPSEQSSKMTNSMAFSTYKGWAEKKLQGGDWGSAQQLLQMPEVRDVLSKQPGTWEDLNEKAQTGAAHANAWNSVSPNWFQKEGFDGEGDALREVNDKYVDNKGQLMGAQKAVKDYFGQQKWTVLSYFAKWGDFPPGLNLSPKMRATFYKQFYNQQDDPRDLAAANDMMLSKKTNMAEYQNFKNTDWTNMDIFPGLSLPTRQKFINAAEKASNGKPAVDPQDATAWAIGQSQVYHYWPSTENMSDLTKATEYTGSDGQKHAPIADFLNNMVSYSQAHPGATSLDLHQYADKYMASTLSQNPQLLQLRAQEIAQSRGGGSPQDIQSIRDVMESDLKANRSGYYGRY